MNARIVKLGDRYRIQTYEKRFIWFGKRVWKDVSNISGEWTWETSDLEEARSILKRAKEYQSPKMEVMFESELDMDKIPSNLDEAVELVKSSMSEDDVLFIKDNSNPTSVHFTVGMAIRNDWSLWDTENPLVKWFQKEYGIDHADDISGVVLDCVWRDVRGEPRRDREQAENTRKYWEVLREAEINGTGVHMEFSGDGTVKITKGKPE
jgi:hypothetical protein